MIATEEEEPKTLYENVEPLLPLGLPFVRMAVSADWFAWPMLPELFPASFSGIKTSRNGFLIDTDLDRLRARVGGYFDASLSHEEIARLYPSAMKDIGNSSARALRDALLRRGGPDEAGFVRHAYRAFDTRWLYWEADSGLLDRPRANYRLHVFEGNSWIEARGREAKEEYSRGTLVRHLADNFGNGLSSFFPAWLRDEDLGGNGDGARRANLSEAAHCYLRHLDVGLEDLFHHVLATLHDPAYREANAGALRMEWPRIPLPGWPDGGDEGAAEELGRSAARGRKLAAAAQSRHPGSGRDAGAVAAEDRRHRRSRDDRWAQHGGRRLRGDRRWGHTGQGDAVMPGQGRTAERTFSAAEQAALSDAGSVLGERTFDIYLNDGAFWRNVPEAVWNYRLGGYQVLKKWLSYRERTVLGRPLKPEEVQHFTDMARRIQGIILLLSQDLPKKEGCN